MATNHNEQLGVTGKFLLIGETAWCYRCGRASRRIIVRSRENGFVTQNCEFCGRPGPLGKEQLPTLNCTPCGRQMEAGKNFNGNYAYRCHSCRTETELAALVPHWNEFFEYNGYAIEDDPAKRRPWL